MPTESTTAILRSTASRKLPPGQGRFIAQLNVLLPCLQTAATAPDPARILYGTAARQSFFYLQSLCRVYRKVQDKSPFKALGERFKAAEDQLGKIDAWDGWLKSADELPMEQARALKGHKEAEIAKLQTLLEMDRWLDDDFAQVREMAGELDAVDWLGEAKDRKGVAEFLAEAFDDLDEDFRDGKFDFGELELGVHEFRRKLRWFSIYAQSLGGLIQLRPVARVEAKFRPYMTKAVLESPFNILPKSQPEVEPIYLSAPHFYALSWLIAEIGIIKDAGLRVEAIHKIAAESGEAVDAKPDPVIAKTVSAISHAFVVENNILRELRDDVRRSAR